MLALDTETTGLDIRHGAKPFFLTTCDDQGMQSFWEWTVDPVTRQPEIPKADIAEIREMLFSGFSNTDQPLTPFIFQNAKFDFAALDSIGLWRGIDLEEVWRNTYDTLMAGHLLASNQRHDLTAMTIQYLGRNIEPLEIALKDACNAARRLARKRFPEWRIAAEGLAEMPSAKETVWKYDTWLPRQIARELGYPEDHPWYTVTQKYANEDSAATIAIFQAQEKELRQRGLWKIYEERMKLLPIAFRMEKRGLTISGARLDKIQQEYRQEAENAGAVCKNIAASYHFPASCPQCAGLPESPSKCPVCRNPLTQFELELPKSGNNNQLRSFVFSKYGLNLGGEAPEKARRTYGEDFEAIIKRSKKTGEPSLDKAAIDMFEGLLPANSKARVFLRNLKAKRKRDTAIIYMEGYRRFMKPWISVGDIDPKTGAGWYVLHPSLNPTGTDTLRWSSANPNEQNISKQEGFNLRYIFGPAPGREWWSLDAKNIELRLPAYAAGETEMIALFERPDDPPYFGSNHLLVSHVLHPKLFEECRDERGQVDGRIFKKKYASTWYQWVKNGNFAVQYGAVEESGTADRAYHVPGGQRVVQSRFSKIKALNDAKIAEAKKFGYVQTMPDRSVDPDHGYPILCSRTDYGDIKPTVPLNYFIQGTAMWWTARAMVRCQAQLDKWRESDGFDGHITLQVHDEMVFDFPKSVTHPKVEAEKEKEMARLYGTKRKPLFRTSNLWRIRILQDLMAQGGDDLGVPIPCGAEYHEDNWAEGVSL